MRLTLDVSQFIDIADNCRMDRSMGEFELTVVVTQVGIMDLYMRPLSVTHNF